MVNRSINIKNFGVIKKANINIKPLNILIGANSSGKSYVAKLIHCFNIKDNTNMINPSQYYKNLNDENKQIFDEFSGKLVDYIKTEPTLKSTPI